MAAVETMAACAAAAYQTQTALAVFLMLPDFLEALLSPE
jgi:hypothetical protein